MLGNWTPRLRVVGLVVGSGVLAVLLLSPGHESRAETVKTRSVAGRSVDIAAEIMDIDLETASATLSGSVKVVSGGLELECPKLNLRYDERSFELSWAKAEGGIRARFEQTRARAPRAEFDLGRQLLVLSGGVELEREGGKIEARRAEVNLGDHRIRLVGVRGSLPVPGPPK